MVLQYKLQVTINLCSNCSKLFNSYAECSEHEMHCAVAKLVTGPASSDMVGPRIEQEFTASVAPERTVPSPVRDMDNDSTTGSLASESDATETAETASACSRSSPDPDVDITVSNGDDDSTRSTSSNADLESTEDPPDCNIYGLPTTEAVEPGKSRRITSANNCVCSFCGRRFLMSSMRANHERQIHTKERPFKCRFQDCTKAFTAASTRGSHEKFTHEKVKNCVCDLCGKKYPDWEQVKVHKRSYHTGERPFQCSYCPMAFFSKGACGTHEKSKHINYVPPTIDLRFQVTCDDCPYKSANRTLMRKHCNGKLKHKCAQLNDKKYSRITSERKTLVRILKPFVKPVGDVQ